MILVTGGTGLVGSHLLYELVKQGSMVRALKRPDSDISRVKTTFSWYDSNYGSLFGNIEWIDGDLLDVHSLTAALDGVSHIYHCAGLVSFKKSDYQKLIQTNQRGTENIVNVSLQKGNIRFCHLSSIAALGGTKASETITEGSFWKTSRNNSVYSVSKYGAEREVWRASEEGLEMFILNPSVIIGPGNWNNGSSQIFMTVNKGVPFYTEGVTGYVDVRDVTKIMVKLMESAITGERFVVSSDNLSYKQLSSMIASALGKKPPSVRLYHWMAGVAWRLDYLLSLLGKSSTFTRHLARTAYHRYYYDSSKIRKLLDYKFLPIEESVAHTAKVFLSEQKNDLKNQPL